MNLSKNPPNVSSFSLHGVNIDIYAHDTISQKVTSLLQQDFNFMHVKKRKDLNEVPIVMQIYGTSSELKKLGVPVFQTKMCKVHGLGVSRICDYGQKTHSRSLNQRNKRTIEIYSEEESTLYEISFTTFLSFLGEALDNIGFHRVHALGLKKDREGVLIVLPQGGGKSAMAALLQEIPEISFFSDESPLISQGKIFAFPMRFALHSEVAKGLKIDITASRIFQRRLFPPKHLFNFQPGKIASEAKVSHILIGKKTNGDPKIRNAPFVTVIWNLWKSIVMGLGNTQMAEHMLRINSIRQLIKIALSRAFEAAKLTVNSDAYIFEVCLDARKNSQILLNFLNNKCGKV